MEETGAHARDRACAASIRRVRQRVRHEMASVRHVRHVRHAYTYARE